MSPEDRERLVRIECGVNALVTRGQDHEDRLRVVEKRQWLAYGGAAVVSFCTGIVLRMKGVV
jgi:hypothetical protein